MAAVPSLHLGGTVLFVHLHVVAACNRWWRPLLVAYPLVMTFSLVYSAEHYLADCIAGALAAFGIHAAANAIERWRSRVRARARYPGGLRSGPPARRPARSPVPASPSAARNDAVVNLSKRRGFVFPSSEIYGGTRSAWDYGPLGVELKENVRRQWWKTMVQRRDDVVGLDSAVILATEVWKASGHVDVFTDPLVECLNCHKRNRADQLEEAFEAKHGQRAGERPDRHRRAPTAAPAASGPSRATST